MDQQLDGQVSIPTKTIYQDSEISYTIN